MKYGNQRYYFDLDEASSTLIAGNPLGQVIGYDIKNNFQCKLFFAAHFEQVPAISYNSNVGILATGSGARLFETSTSDSDSDSSDNEKLQAVNTSKAEANKG